MDSQPDAMEGDGEEIIRCGWEGSSRRLGMERAPVIQIRNKKKKKQPLIIKCRQKKRPVVEVRRFDNKDMLKANPRTKYNKIIKNNKKLSDKSSDMKKKENAFKVGLSREICQT